jgi:hypothetical protein
MLETEVVTEAGAPVVLRRAERGDVPRLRAIAERLVEAAHPGVVEVLSSAGDDQAWELRLTYAGRPLDVVGSRMDAIAVARLVASLASVVADLHGLGVTHGRIEPSHVLVGGDGRAVLCGFGPDAGGCSPEDDVAALGGLIVQLLGRDDELEPIPDRRWRQPSSWTGWQRRSMLLLADQACAEPPSRRPTARRFAAAIAEAVPGSVVDAGAPPVPTRRMPLVVMSVAGFLLLGVIANGMAPPPGAHERTSAPTSQPAQVEGNQVTMGGRRFQVGAPGDVVVVGDWDCDGVPTPAVLRPATGSLFVFSDWAERTPVQVSAARSVEGAASIRPQPDAAGCDQLQVTRRDGAPVIVDTGGA